MSFLSKSMLTLLAGLSRFLQGSNLFRQRNNEAIFTLKCSLVCSKVRWCFSF